MKRLFLIVSIFFSGVLIAREPTLFCEKKWGEVNWQGMVFHRYRLRAEHFPSKQTFRLIVKNGDGTQTETFKYLANTRGHLIVQPPEDIEGDIYAICPAKRGERLTFVMQSEKDGVAYTVDLIPFPLEMKSKKGVVLNLELQGEKGEKFLLVAHHLKPFEEVKLFLALDERETLVDAKVTEAGDLRATIELKSEQGEGNAKLLLVRKSEKVVFPFQWGTPVLDFVGACCLEIR